jgi:hypothetical protein
VADAAEKNFDLDIVRGWITAFDLSVSQRGCRTRRRIGFRIEHDLTLLVKNTPAGAIDRLHWRLVLVSAPNRAISETGSQGELNAYCKEKERGNPPKDLPNSIFL